jgi:multidrug efflux pump subunit AcrA (membrane-fusion protein)
MKKIINKPFLLPVALLVAIAVVVFLVKGKASVVHEVTGYPVKTVEVINADKIPFRARAMAFGNVKPSVVLNTKSEVNGKISYMHPDLEKGASLAKDTIVLRIEPTTFEISLDESMAALKNSQLELDQLAVEEKTARDALVIARKNLQVELKELERVQSLLDKKIISQSTLDKEEQKVLTLRQQLQDIEGKVAAFDSRRESIKARIKQSSSQVEKNQDTLGRTEVRLPFDARIGTVAVEEGEYVQAGAMLFEALGLQAVEIDAQIPTRQFRPLVITSNFADNGPRNLQNPANLQAALSGLGLEARVRLVGNTGDAMLWQGSLLRLSESVDPTRDTLGLVVVVEKPYADVIPGKRPPLLKGMYAAVELVSPVRPSLVLPRKAVHQGRVYVATEENILAIRAVDVLFSQGDLVVVAEDGETELKPGEKLIISDVIPVIEGMPLNPVRAGDYERRMKNNALGESAAGTVQ